MVDGTTGGQTHDLVKGVVSPSAEQHAVREPCRTLWMFYYWFICGAVPPRGHEPVSSHKVTFEVQPEAYRVCLDMSPTPSWKDHGKEVRFSRTEKTLVIHTVAPEVSLEDSSLVADDSEELKVPPTPSFPKRQQKRLCGLPKFWFLIFVAVTLVASVVTAIVSAIYLMKDKNSSQDEDISQQGANCTDLAASTCTTSPEATADGCPFTNETEYVSRSNGLTYITICGIYWNSGDVFQPKAATFKDCIDECGSYNNQADQAGKECHGIGWLETEKTCWLKSVPGKAAVIADPNDVQSAFLKDQWTNF